MIAIDLPTSLERHLWDIVRGNYNGSLQEAIASFLQLHEKYGWKEQLLKDVQSIQSEVRRRGDITEKEIDAAVKKYRETIG